MYDFELNYQKSDGILKTKIQFYEEILKLNL